MATIKQLSEADIVENGDQFPFFSEAQGDTRKVTFATLKDSVATDFVSTADLAAQTGATLVGCNGGTNVQQELDALDGSKASLAALAASSGSSLVGFIQSGTGATARTAQSKMRETFSVFDCMSEALQSKISSLTATTSDATAINAAIDAAIANAVARAPNQEVNIFFPDGDYYYNSITIASNRINLVGNARLIKVGATGDGIVFDGSSGRKFGGGVQGLTLGSAVSATGGALLKFVEFSQIEVTATIKPFPAAGWLGMYFDQCSAVKIGDGTEVEGCNHDGIQFNDCVDVYLLSGRSDANGRHGVLINNVSGIYGSSFTCYGNASDGWKAEAVGTPAFADAHGYMFFSDCVGDSNGGHNWYLKAVSNSIFSACWGSSQSNTTADLHGFLVYGCFEVEFNSCIALANNGSGIRFDGTGSTGIFITGGKYNNNGKVSTSSKREGISIGTSCDVTIVGARTTDLQSPKTQLYGVGADATLLSLSMTGCDMRGNSTGPYRFAAQPALFSQSNNRTGETASFASATSVTTSPFIDKFAVTGTTDIFDFTPKWEGRKITIGMVSTARLVDEQFGGELALPDPTVTPGADGVACFVRVGSKWLMTSYSVNDGA